MRPPTSMGDPLRSGERGGSASKGFDVRVDRSRSFAEFVSILNRLNALEAALATAIARARVPLPEVRQLLRAQGPAAAENAPAFQFMREVFAQVGIPLAVEGVSRFSMVFGVDESPYTRLSAAEGAGKTCGFVSGALARFLAADFGLPAEVEEVACRNEGAARCRFVAALDSLPTASRALDAGDWRLFRNLAASGAPDDLPQDERDFRMETLIGYGLLASDGRLLANGEALAKAGPPEAETAEPPWREASRLTEAIADAASAAEALVEVAPRATRQDVRTDPETVALAADCHSFAELLARASKGRDWE